MNAKQASALASIVEFSFKPDDENESVRSSIKTKRRFTKIIPISDVSHRLNKRKQLHNQW